MAGQDFGWALARIRSGARVRRRIWTQDEWIELRSGKIFDEDGTETRFTSSEPLLACDWQMSEWSAL